MIADELTLRPLLRRHPDARRAKAPLLHPILLPYLALIFGSGVAAVAAFYNALMLRRGGLAVRSLLVGLAGWLVFLIVVGNAVHFGLHNVRIAVILGRIIHFAFGGLLYTMHRPHFTGNQFRGGRALPIVQSYVVAFILYFIAPTNLLLLLLGVPLG